MASRWTKRFAVIAGATALGFGAVTFSLTKVVLVDGSNLAVIARRQHSRRVLIPEERGMIMDRNGSALAASLMAPSVFVHPKRLQGKATFTNRLAASLGLSARTVGNKLSSERPFVWLRRAVTPRQAAEVSALRLAGVGITREPRRYYPHGMLAAHVMGFTGIDMKGLEGAECFFDEILRGQTVAEEVERDALGRPILTRVGLQDQLRKGAAIELTIDTPLQYITEQALAEGVKEAGARAGSAIVLDPWTGEILAMANVPTFDPNRANEASPAQIRNRAITDIYEPGSTIKPILVAAALESGVVTSESTFFCEQGKMKIGGRVIHDHHPHGWLSVPEIIQVSSNIGVAKIVDKLGAKRYYDYLRRFGLGEKLGVDLPGEVSGLIASPRSWSAIRTVNAAFGQGLAVTPLQLATAFAALANGGYVMRPHVARRAIGPQGTVIWERRPEKIKRAITNSTARALTAMLEKVVEPGGSGEKAWLEEYRVAGKTGTAQKVDSTTGRYAAKAVVASFVGYLPARNPRAVILVVIDEPSRGRYGGVVAAPVFRKIALEAVRRLQVPPRDDLVREVRRGQRNKKRLHDALSGMPSFLGMSLREALVTAAEAGWEVEAKGSGYVKAQVPRPGAPASPGRVLVLSLAPRVDMQ